MSFGNRNRHIKKENVSKKNVKRILLGILAACVLIGIISIPSIKAYRVDAAKAKFYQNGIELMRQGNWSEAKEIFNDMLPTNPIKVTSYSNNEQERYEESEVLSHYAYAKSRYDEDRESSWDELKLFVPENYSGAFADDIKTFKKQLESDPITQEAIRVEAIRYAKSVNSWESATNTPAAPSVLKIGMTASEVLASTWGTPKDKNKTTTANGVNEQWVYSSGKYVYLKDGIVTAIQE